MSFASLLSVSSSADRRSHSSAVKLAYSDAQEVIEGRPLPDAKIEGDHSQRAGVEGDIKMLAVSSLAL